MFTCVVCIQYIRTYILTYIQPYMQYTYAKTYIHLARGDHIHIYIYMLNTIDGAYKDVIFAEQHRFMHRIHTYIYTYIHTYIHKTYRNLQGN